MCIRDRAYAAYAGQETADGTTGATQKNVEQPADSTACLLYTSYTQR